MRIGYAHKTRGLLHESFLLEINIKEDILDIKLFERPLKVHAEREDKMNSRGLDNKAKSFTKVKSRNLGKPFSN